MPAYVPQEFMDACKGSYNMALFMRFGTIEPLRIALGFSSIPIGIDGIDAEGSVYLAVGGAHELPDIDVLINGVADEVSIKISGVSERHAALIAESGPPVIGYECHMGAAPLDERWQPKTKILPLWQGIGDHISIEMSEQRDMSGPASREITFVMMSGETARSRQPLTTYTDFVQQALSPGDKACDRVPRYTRDYRAPWPNY